MRMWSRLLFGVAVAAAFGMGVYVAVGIPGTARTSSSAVDISGPCDEAENADDPRCDGTGTGTAATPSPSASATPGDDDISGPCDEAEHANDPRCTGTGDGDDNSGPGNEHDGDDDNSGPGNGHNDDDRDDDNSGPGSGDDD